MKKNWIFYVFLLTAFINVCLVSSAKSQGTGIIVDTSSFPQKKETKPFVWKVRNELDVSNNFDTPNGINLVRGSITRNKTSFDLERGKYNYLVETSFIVPTNRNNQNIFGSLGVGVARKFSAIDIAVTGRYYKSRQKSFAIADADFSKTLLDKQALKLRQFSNLSWYLPTESNYNTVSSGLVWRNGLKLETELGPSEFTFGEQLILDSGAVQSGRRIGINTEITCLVPFYALRFGPKVSYTKFLNEKKNRFNFGVIFKIR